MATMAEISEEEEFDEIPEDEDYVDGILGEMEQQRLHAWLDLPGQYREAEARKASMQSDYTFGGSPHMSPKTLSGFVSPVLTPVLSPKSPHRAVTLESDVGSGCLNTVSYTHLTLPTKRIV
eukprot:TRINITY_DN4085_c0_g1_i12.p1 TRINITY_DN4085_c0_g1~~TRINITY_DN4085_c0_g1_i12.p1  ORF type:complete len:121 (-),score=18.13 TRINITY_DN4085_c0_g1_i12:118-480(-)